MTGPAVVAFGGGHGLAASLAALAQVTDRLTAVVTVADDGGSSGRLRAEFPELLPPGDLRMALAALAGDREQEQAWVRVLQHRFAGPGELAGHAVGNLLLAGLCASLGDPVAALDQTAALVGARGRVLPLSTTPLDIEADVTHADGLTVVVRGQHAVASTTGQVAAVRLVPPDPPACADALDAVRAADWVVLGPGSLFTSVVPHLLLSDVREALRQSGARVAYLLNLAPQPGETAGFSPARHLEVLLAHAPWLRLSRVIADDRALHQGAGDGEALITAARAVGAELVTAPVAAQADGNRHDPALLAAVLRRTLTAPAPPDRDAGSANFPAVPASEHVPHPEALWRQ
jgi:uncharacterized cofD-like protein